MNLKIEPMVLEKPVLISKIKISDKKIVHYKDKTIMPRQEISAIPKGYYLFFYHPWAEQSGYDIRAKRGADADGILIVDHDILEKVKPDEKGMRSVDGDFVFENYDMVFEDKILEKIAIF